MGTTRTKPETMGESDVIDLLQRQHALIRNLFDEVERTTGDERREAFQRLVRLLAVHETAEEEIVHPYARRVLPGGVEVVDERLEEERQAKELLQQMDEAGVDDPNFMTNLERLRLDVLAHARAEERYEFVQLRAHTTEAERRSMAAGVKAAEAMAPTHPHPGVESATKNLLVGTPMAIFDRVRDVVRKAMGKQP
ncbi:hemerythrin [Thermopolyspora flexuosa]|jgi:hemerythrin superfamily protein|uniref:Hemerythrin HHE cation binding domain-containing protein n=1 Tax=Thermopolyspora flexuosa TaxID=103836 RepID=A0A543J4A4_9ACTN|nr:hemerythrin domain-containing protein [Thermopolyspora flexuosa]TQM77659.1 hemerythrin HHE cation binding domain-containing protein [Thermopolyspora flexuosa]GGM71702.1 hemerythrin [Thermopolyspora flexuosa]